MITAARWISLIAAFLWGAVAEWHLGIAVGADVYTACLLPLTLDVYGFAAMKSGRTAHVAGALVTMFGAQTAAHLLALGGARWYMTSLAIVVSAVPPAVSLACHRLGVKRVTVDTAPVVVANDGDSVYAGDYAAQIGAYATVAPVDAPAETPGDTVHAAMETFLVNQASVDAAYMTPPVTVDAPAETVVAPVVTREVAPVEMTKAEYAREGARLISQNYTKTAAAESLGISRQWLHVCMKEYSLV